MSHAISIADVRRAAQRIAPHVLRTPVFTSAGVDAKASEILKRDVRVHFKMEVFQKTGAFKIRGACNAVFALSEEDASKGVVTQSSGM